MTTLYLCRQQKGSKRHKRRRTRGKAVSKPLPIPSRNLTRRLSAASPAPSSAPKGKQWLLDWMDACGGGCTVDFIAVHYYDINSTQFMDYLEDYHNTFQRPVWVTEWACQVGTISDFCDWLETKKFTLRTSTTQMSNVLNRTSLTS